MNLFGVQMIGPILYSVPGSARRLPWIYHPSPGLVMTDARRSSPWRGRGATTPVSGGRRDEATTSASAKVVRDGCVC
jgi:hypothetical protein